MKQVRISCPTCLEKGRIEVDEDVLKNNSRGLIAVNVATDIICPHSFFAYVDRNLNVRDYFIADFLVELPEIALPKKFKPKMPSSEIIDIFLIKLNLSGILLTYILKSVFSKQKIVVILDDLRYRTPLKTHVLNFFKYLTKGSFDADITVIAKGRYIKSEWKKHMVFEGNNIIRNAKKIINLKNLKIERVIVQNFLAEDDATLGLFFLKNEIQKAYELSKSIVDYVENFSEIEKSSFERIEEGTIIEKIFDQCVKKEKLIPNLILEYLKEKYNTKIQKFYLDFLIDIVKSYFEMDVINRITFT